MKYIYFINRFNLKEKTDAMAEKLKKLCQKYDRDYEILINDTAEEAISSMDQFKDTEYVITGIGGDGSINILLNSLIGTKNILSFIPYGTGNDFYRFCKENYEDGIRDVDIVRINDSYFINVACFGIDADIANDDNFIHNSRIPSSMRYNAGVVYYFLTYSPRKLKVEANDEVIEKEITTVVVSNAQYYGGGYRVSPYGNIEDGKLEVLIADKLSKIPMAKVILSMKDAGHLKNPAVSSYTAEKVIISSDEEFSCNIDGEALKAKRFEIEVIPKGFRIDYQGKFIEEFLK